MSYAVLPLTFKESDMAVFEAISNLLERSLRHGIEVERRESRPPRLECMIGVFALNAFVDRQAFETFSARFGGNVETLLFLNKCAVSACQEFGIEIHPAGKIDDAELPPNRAAMLTIGYYR